MTGTIDETPAAAEAHPTKTNETPEREEEQVEEDVDDGEIDGDGDEDEQDDQLEDKTAVAGGKRGCEAVEATKDSAPKVDAEKEEEQGAKPKKARIAMPPAVDSSSLDVDEYSLDAPPTEESTDEAKSDSPSLILFGLHPLIREPPLKKMCEKYGKIMTIEIRSAFASRYGHVQYSNVAEAKAAYKALNGAKLLHKAILVQPTKPSTPMTTSASMT